MSENNRKRNRMERVNEARRVMRKTDPERIYNNYDLCNHCKFQDDNGNCDRSELYPYKGLSCYRYEKK